MTDIQDIFDEIHARGLVREAVVGLVGPVTLTKDFISLIGSTAENGSGNDIDILIRSKEDRHIRTRLQTLFPTELAELLHLVWEGGSSEVLHDTYIPLFDLCLMPASHAMVEIQSGRFNPGNGFGLPKSTIHTFNEDTQIAKYLEADTDARWAVEQKFDGLRTVIHKKGDTVKIFDGQAKDITKNFPSIVAQAKELTSKDFIIDGEMVLVDARGRSTTKDELMSFINGKETLADDNIRYHVFDILYLGVTEW